MGTVIVHPEPQFVQAVAQELLALADSPHQVEYVMWPAVGFRIPEELLARWEALSSRPLPEGADRTDQAVDLITEAVASATEEPVKRKPGRPKKNTEGQ